MRHEDDEARLLRLWRDAAGEMPGELLDRRIITWAWRALRDQPGS